MANKMYEESNIQAIADAIRAKGITGTMTVAEMADKISSISGATEPYIEETYDSDGHIIGLSYHGHNTIKEIIPSAQTTLQSLYLSESVVNIMSGVFANALELTTISFPHNLQNIEYSAFSWCPALKSITIPCNPNIGGDMYGGAFFGSGLTSATIGAPGKPMDEAKMPAAVFQNCDALTSITIYTEGGAPLTTAPFGATNAIVTYIAA